MTGTKIRSTFGWVFGFCCALGTCGNARTQTPIGNIPLSAPQSEIAPMLPSMDEQPGLLELSDEDLRAPSAAQMIGPIEPSRLDWWSIPVREQVTELPRWVRFDLETVLLDTLAHSPRILSVGYRTSATAQEIVEQDAAFDSSLLLSGDLGATNDPVGNSLTTGGANRLRERSFNVRGGTRKTTRRGTEVEWSQQIGLLDSNSSFFVPTDQGNARLNLSLNKPLLSRGDQYFNERLVTEARLDTRVAWQDMRADVERRIAEVLNAYWKLYELRAQLSQQRALLGRGRALEKILISRKDFDAARIEIVKAKQRVARRFDEVIDLEAELVKQQAKLAALIGNEELLSVNRDLELIPTVTPTIAVQSWTLRDAVAQAMANRPEIRAATHEVELSALELRVSRVELEPELNFFFNGYLGQLNGARQAFKSFGQQWSYGPGVASGIEYELPFGRRAAKANNRAALYRARQRSQLLREAIQQAQFENETALIELDRFTKQQLSKRDVLANAVVEENILTVQWRLMGADESRVGIKLENLLDAQQRRTDAEKDLVAVEVSYMIALVELQRAMGTLLINEGIRPHQQRCYGEIHFARDQVGKPPAGGIMPEQESAFPLNDPERSMETESPLPAPAEVMDADLRDTSHSGRVNEFRGMAQSSSQMPGARKLPKHRPSWLGEPEVRNAKMQRVDQPDLSKAKAGRPVIRIAERLTTGP